MRSNPTASKRQLGAALRRLRAVAGLTAADVARRLEWSAPKVSSIETARVRTHPNDVRLLMDVYEVTDEAERDLLLQLCRGSRNAGWWQQYGGKALQQWATQFIGLEDAATEIQYFGLDLVYGPTQTSDYARAVIAAGARDYGGDDVERAVQLRGERRSHLLSEDGPQVWMVLDEAALRRTIGGQDVMREQLEFLVELSHRRNITIQVLPASVGAHPMLGSAFQIISFAEGDSIVYIEDLTSAQYMERGEDLRRYSAGFNMLRAMALSPEASQNMVETIAEELK
ncbi:helix-turn-helix domain-containing protein [Actinoalloteichus caeruleus]|uniref:helix-turn-helix domain-containing protein n=1 Tax=Actinoalloteichus cyanogriseus TaxID=2893586 RepID=UPI003BB96613